VLVIQYGSALKDVTCIQGEGDASYKVQCAMGEEVIDEPGIKLDISQNAGSVHFWIQDNENVKVLPTNVVNTFPNIFGYNVANCTVERVISSDFKYMTSLVELNLFNNEISDIAEDAFVDLRSLNLLDLSNNRLKHLSNNIFKGLTALVRLFLDRNRIESVDENSFKALEMLERLRLDNNSITILPEHLLRNVVKIEQISLSQNKLETLHRDFFDTNPRLITVLLEKNNLSVLSYTLFSNKKNLSLVNLLGNVCINSTFSTNVVSELSIKNMIKILDESCRDINDEIVESTKTFPKPFHVTLWVILVIDILVCFLYIITCALSKFEKYI
jgi:Leucine rich repeat/BspA type Leucine rich repeat region (6 copies)